MEQMRLFGNFKNLGQTPAVIQTRVTRLLVGRDGAGLPIQIRGFSRGRIMCLLSGCLPFSGSSVWFSLRCSSPLLAQPKGQPLTRVALRLPT